MKYIELTKEQFERYRSAVSLDEYLSATNLYKKHETISFVPSLVSGWEKQLARHAVR